MQAMVTLSDNLLPLHRVSPSIKWQKYVYFFFFFWETHFHSVTTQMQAMVTLSDNLLPLHRVSPSIKWQKYV